MRILEILAQDSTWCRDQDVREDYLRINNMATDQALTRFKSRRNGHRLHIKNLEEEVNVILDDEFEETSRPKLDALKQKLTTQLTKIETLDNEIINLVKDTDVETKVSETQIYLDKYSDLILKIESVLKPQPQNNGNKSESQATTLNQSQSSSNKEAKVRLPKIELPHFLILMAIH